MSSPETPSRINHPSENSTSHTKTKPTQKIDLSEIAKDLLPKDTKALIDFMHERDASDESDALDILANLKTEEPDFPNTLVEF